MTDAGEIIKSGAGEKIADLVNKFAGPSLVDLLDLPLAWQRMNLDRPDRVFYTHPHLFEWIEIDLKGWLFSVEQRLRDGYAPHTALTCAVPKPGWLVRPGTVLDEQDELVLNALVGAMFTRCYDLLKTFQGDPDVAFQLQKPSMKKWVKRGFVISAEWRTKSLQKLKTAQFVVLSDIAGFFENIDLQRLNSDLKRICDDQPLLSLLMRLLSKWAHPRGKGIPQGYSAADILAKIYLNPIDRALQNAGFTHLRYVDDIRIFCKSRLEAKRGLLLLNDLMRKRGLNLQSAKTKIVRANEALNEIAGVTPIIEAIQSELAVELHDAIGDASGVTVADIERFFNESPSNPKPEVLERAFSEHFKGNSEKFNKTLLHFLLTRLAKAKSTVAVKYAVELLQQRPEETEWVLPYLGEVGIDEQDEQEMLDYLSSPEAIYDYQTFQIVAWFSERTFIPDQLVQLCRGWSADRNKELWLRVAARGVLARVGDQSDLEAIESSYDVRLGDLECADIVHALSRVEASSRNSFFGRVSSDGDLTDRAIRKVRTAAGARPSVRNRS